MNYHPEGRGSAILQGTLPRARDAGSGGRSPAGQGVVPAGRTRGSGWRVARYRGDDNQVRRERGIGIAVQGGVRVEDDEQTVVDQSMARHERSVQARQRGNSHRETG